MSISPQKSINQETCQFKFSHFKFKLGEISLQKIYVYNNLIQKNKSFFAITSLRKNQTYLLIDFK